MKIYIKKHESHAGKWIYTGIKNAWDYYGYETVYFNNFDEISPKNNIIITTDSTVTKSALKTISESKKTFLFVQPKSFCDPWGKHPNFVSSLDSETIKDINSISNIQNWTFCDTNDYYKDWNNVYTIPLAFDDISYQNTVSNKNFEFDVCFIGGRANNGFDEKYIIMKNVFSNFQNKNLKCGFFINKNLTHEQERDILYNSKVCLNIHDAYQRKLGYDTNERTFKSLGLNGVLVTEKINQCSRLFPDVSYVKDDLDFLTQTLLLLEKKDTEILQIKKEMQNHTLTFHTYKNRVKVMLGFL